MKNKNYKTILLGLVFVTISGCASTKISEPVAEKLTSQYKGSVCGNLSYQGFNQDYVPTFIANSPNSLIQLEYAYEVKYNVEPDTAFDLFNPFLILGAPKSSDNVYVSAQLSVSDSGGFEKNYRHAINLSKTTNLFSQGDTLSVMRKKGLIALRDAIDQQLLDDHTLLKTQGLTCKQQGNT